LSRTFLLGVGAQKAGTTWLHEALSGLETVNFGAMKEYHVWDAVLSPEFKRFLLPKDVLSERLTGAGIRFLMQNEPGYYAEYFNCILESGHTLTGDITPSYAALSDTELSHVRDCLGAINARLRVVFLMRDPVERCWSAARMEKRNKDIRDPDEAVLREVYQSQPHVLRTRYDRTVRNLRAVFSAEELYFGLYETMHSDVELQRLSDFLGVSIDPQSTAVRYNAGPKTEQISSETRAMVQTFYRDVYEYCWQEFPATRRLWPV
jgi:Sulfotransferase family